jgi:hypothetical protein
VPPHLSVMKKIYNKYRARLTGKLEFEEPHKEVLSFQGYLKLQKDPKTEVLTNDNFIPRGSVLKSLGWYIYYTFTVIF